MKTKIPFTIISGGQTGADRAALDFAIKNKIPHAGWCPKGRLAEDGVLKKKYKLTETPHKNYEERTEWNIRDSDATVIFACQKKLAGGTLHTRQIAKRLKKPILVLTKNQTKSPEKKLIEFISAHNFTRLNVAGPRASKEPEVYAFVVDVLKKCLPDMLLDFE